MQRGRAIEIGQEAVGWLLVRPERLVELATASGLGLDALPGLVEEPEFLGFLLDFVMSSDATVLDFAAHAGLRPEEPAQARAALAGAAGEA
jgi:hypothetical protein